ncbi:hypothetical protein [Methylobacterium sp. sgz302541]|uniref:hypothetical protein n=1 Tax=unclassified Methylobacterium TaxID=2615210 RepID=UPI003D34BF72
MTEPRAAAGKSSELLTDIRVALARMEERQVALQTAADAGQKAAEARHTSLMQTIATFVPRSEIEKDHRALHDRIDALEGRLGTMEKRIWGVVAAIGGTVLHAVAGAFGIMVKSG